MLNRLRTIKSLPLIAVLFTCVVLLSSAAIFASEDGSSSSEVSSFLAPDNSSLVAKEIAEQVYDKLSSDTRATYTIDDVYNILYGALRGQSRSSVYNLPRIASYLNRIEQWIATGSSDPTSASATLTGLLSQINSHVYDSSYSVTGSGTMSTVRLWDLLYRLAPINNLGTNQFPLVYSPAGSGFSYTLAELQGMTWGIVGDISSSLNLTNSYLSSLTSSYNWISYPGYQYLGTSSGLDYTWISNSGSYTSVSSAFKFTDQNNPYLVRVQLPVYYNSRDYNISDFSLKLYSNFNQNPTFLEIPVSDYFIVPAGHSMYVYLFDFQPYPGFTYFFQISNSKSLYFDSSANHTVSYLPFNTDEYQQIKQSFYSQKTANSFGSIGVDVNRLADYFVSPEKQAAEDASQQVIDDTLVGFTGSGSAAAKGSDIGSMKNISGSVQSGLDSGGSVGDAASVFTDVHFWEWFTQGTSDGINNPYPAPVVNQRRGSGDDIPDFISGDKEELDAIRNRRDRW